MGAFSFLPVVSFFPESDCVSNRRVLFLYYSYSGQTRKLLKAFANGLEDGGAEVIRHQIRPLEKLVFPLPSMMSAVKMMVETFFRRRVAIEEVDEALVEHVDLIVLAGPTWSYNPSGPILSFIDCHGEVLAGRRVMPFISCRGYWRMHYWQLKFLLKKHGAGVVNPLIFLHRGPEPWRTIGVFLKTAGKHPEAEKSWMHRYYKRFGHYREQVALAERYGREYAALLDPGDGGAGDITKRLVERKPVIVP